MIIEYKKAPQKIVCDMKGCVNTADYYIRIKGAVNDGEAIKLCKHCIIGIVGLYEKYLKKENKSVKNN